eukprot:TRINITY_DN91233_c0_g1_i1.p1 TRINITY_DN91233_c0_g1~~TRINITY_DN91233_c0_g1_i1.p1  ORF type:complete len:570 (+),score=92.49 TRINITY_DN91233_c0_g1_i1:124-1833(+)
MPSGETDKATEKELQRIRRLPENKVCPNCAKEDRLGFTAVCMAYKTFICSECKSAHQSFSHRCKSTAMSIWTMDEVKSLDGKRGGGNAACRASWLANVSESERPNKDSSLDAIKRFIERAYIEKRWVGDPATVSGGTDGSETSPVEDSPNSRRSRCQTEPVMGRGGGPVTPPSQDAVPRTMSSDGRRHHHHRDKSKRRKERRRESSKCPAGLGELNMTEGGSSWSGAWPMDSAQAEWEQAAAACGMTQLPPEPGYYGGGPPGAHNYRHRAATDGQLTGCFANLPPAAAMQGMMPPAAYMHQQPAMQMPYPEPQQHQLPGPYADPLQQHHMQTPPQQPLEPHPCWRCGPPPGVWPQQQMEFLNANPAAGGAAMPGRPPSAPAQASHGMQQGLGLGARRSAAASATQLGAVGVGSSPARYPLPLAPLPAALRRPRPDVSSTGPLRNPWMRDADAVSGSSSPAVMSPLAPSNPWAKDLAASAPPSPTRSYVARGQVPSPWAPTGGQPAGSKSLGASPVGSPTLKRAAANPWAIRVANEANPCNLALRDSNPWARDLLSQQTAHWTAPSPEVC